MEPLSNGRESLSRAQSQRREQYPARDCLSSVARVKLYVYDQAIDFQTWKVLDQTASSLTRLAFKKDSLMHPEELLDLSPEALGSSLL